LRWLATFPPNRLAASVCTGSLLWAAEGRLKKKRATTHASAMDALENFGAIAQRGARVVADEAVLTAAGVTASLDLGLELVARFTDMATRQAIAKQMEMPEA
jgi:cyclohexyl-isocyanide hydratase